MTKAEPYLFGDQHLHNRLGILVGILGSLAVETPRAVPIRRLREYCDCSSIGVNAALACLAQSNFVRLGDEKPGYWRLANDLSLITLEDLVYCILSTRKRRRQNSPAEKDTSERLAKNVDLFLSQATIEINQQAFKYLRCMSLDRLKRRPQVLLQPRNVDRSADGSKEDRLATT